MCEREIEATNTQKVKEKKSETEQKNGKTQENQKGAKVFSFSSWKSPKKRAVLRHFAKSGNLLRFWEEQGKNRGRTEEEDEEIIRCREEPAQWPIGTTFSYRIPAASGRIFVYDNFLIFYFSNYNKKREKSPVAGSAGKGRRG